MRQLVVQLLAVIQQQATRIAALEARVSQNFSNSDRPPSSDPPGELSGSQRDSRSTVQEFCMSVLGGAHHRGGIQRCVDRVAPAIQAHDEAIAEQARAARVNDVAETAWYQHGAVAWLWVMVNTTGALFIVQASRNKTPFAALIER